MFKFTALITHYPETGAQERQRIEEVLKDATNGNDQVVFAHLQPTLPRGYNAGDLLWHVQFADEASYRRCILQAQWRDVEHVLSRACVAKVDSAAYAQRFKELAEPTIKNGTYRTLMITILPGHEDRIAQFEAEQCAMARHIPVIRNWALSRVVESRGDRRWDYVWEQEFHDYGSWIKPYMAHPYHFAVIHRWFDPESPDRIQDTQCAVSLCAFTDSLLATSSRLV